MRLKAAWLPLLALALMGLFSAGCAPSEGDGLSQKEVELGKKSDEIIKSAGGKWENLSPEDRDYLIREIGQGNQTNAKMFFNAKSGNLRRGAPPAPPTRPAPPGG